MSAGLTDTTPEVDGQVEIDHLPDDELARRARAGCEASFSLLVTRLQPMVLRFLAGRTSNRHEAEDVAQDTFTRVMTRLDQYDPSKRFSPWLLTIAARLAVSRHRKRRPQVQVEMPDPEAPASDPAEQAAARETTDNLWLRAAEVLSDLEHEALWLRYAEGLRPHEIAKQTYRTPGAVRVSLFRARQKLAAALGEQED